MLETLEQWGCETEKTMERFLDDKEFECTWKERNSVQFGTGSYCEYIEQDRRAASHRQNRWCNGAI